TAKPFHTGRQVPRVAAHMRMNQSFFFFQAEDGIRDFHVTGVQTCALPICLQQPMIAMVGSRNPTPYAREWTQQTARELAATGVTVVSGLALGIDGAAHQGALESGRTVAVLGGGVDVSYPPRHLGLAQMIMHKGLLLSEFAPGTAPQPSHFPSRNRIVSGLSLGTVVAEAASKSGSLITAKLAAEQGREVFALPGAVTNPLSHGCHQL